MALAPATDSPMAKPAIPCSHSGVLNTRSLPNFSARPTVHLNTPPKATSSPKMQAVWSVVRAMSMASVIDWRRVIFSVGPRLGSGVEGTN